MNNSEFVKTNNNEECTLNTSLNNDVSNEENCTTGTQNDNNAKENYNVSKIAKDKGHKMLFGMDKSMNVTLENNSNVFACKEILFNESNGNEKDVGCLKSEHGCQRKESLLVSKGVDNDISFANQSIEVEENRNHNKNYFENKSLLNDIGLPSVSNLSDTKSVDGSANIEVQSNNSQPMSSKLNIVPNPNEFNLVGKNNSSKNPEFLNLNQSTNEVLVFADNSIVISNSNAIPQSDSIVSGNYSLSLLQGYISDDDDISLIEESSPAPQPYRGGQQMEDSEDSDSSTSSSTSIFISETSSDSESADEYEDLFNKPECKPIKAKGELDLCDLPPIEDLTISVPEEECIPVGKIYQIVDQLVIVQADKDTPAYDLDTILFTQAGKPLGKVFDVMGPVTEPYYCIRFNSKAHIEEKNIALNQTVYVAPKTQYSKFVFLAQLMQLKGSDASWEHDHEPPEVYLDYSDDEQEQRAKKKNFRNKKAASKPDSDPDEPARKRHSAYVKRMNARNLKLSASRANHNRAEKGNNMWQPNSTSMTTVPPIPPRATAPCHPMFGRPQLFDARVPQPNPPFINHSGPQFHRPEFSVFNYIQNFPGPSNSPQAPPFPQPPDHPFFPRPPASPGACGGLRMPPFSPPPPYCRLPNNQGFNSNSLGGNAPLRLSNNAFTPPPPPHRNGPPMRNGPPPINSFPLGSFRSPAGADFYGSSPNVANSPQRPPFNVMPPWTPPPNNRGHSPRFLFNPAFPPPPN